MSGRDAKSRPEGRLLLRAAGVSRGLLALDDPSALDAGRACVERLVSATGDDGMDPLDIRIPATAGPAMRVRDRFAETRLLTTDVANASHGKLLEYRVMKIVTRSNGQPV